MKKVDIFMTMCYLLAEASKDDNTKIGAVIVGPDGDIRSTGWNSYPRGLDDTLDYRQDHAEKQYWFVHAEMNAILNAGRNGIPLKGSTLYTTAFPCHDCAQAIIQSGIETVVYDTDLAGWDESGSRAQTMLYEAGVTVLKYGGRYIDVKRRVSGQVSDLMEE